MSEARVFGTTPESLMDGLMNEISVLAKDIHFYGENGQETELKVHDQHLPIKKDEEREDIFDSFPADGHEDPHLLDVPESEGESEFPYCVIKIDTIKVDGIKKKRSVDIILEVGLYYDKEDCQYQHSMLTLFEKIQRRFLINPILGAAECEPDMVFAVDPNDEETYPYYFGGAALRFLIPNYEREDENS